MINVNYKSGCERFRPEIEGFRQFHIFCPGILHEVFFNDSYGDMPNFLHIYYCVTYLRLVNLDIMKVSAVLRNQLHKNEIVVTTNSDSKSITIPSKASGYGSSVNGAELLLLSLATCYCNDIYREAAKRNIEVYDITVEFSGEFGGEGEPGRDFHYRPIIKSNATTEQLEDLITFTDSVAEIHRTLRQGLSVTLQK